MIGPTPSDLSGCAHRVRTRGCSSRLGSAGERTFCVPASTWPRLWMLLWYFSDLAFCNRLEATCTTHDELAQLSRRAVSSGRLLLSGSCCV